MKKRFTKIICVTAGIIAAAGITASAAGCSNYFSGKKLTGNTEGTVEKYDNGGFAVKKGNYIYFINGVESNTADNKFGSVVKGGIYRISTDDFAKHNYSTVDCVVPQIAYTADYDAGMFIYGDYVYYATPSVEKNSDGVVQNSTLDLRSTKLDGTKTLKTPYVQFPSTSYKYRFVEEKNTVYLMYVATEEKLFDEDTGVTNLHSYNTATGKDTLLAYNVGSVVFDKTDKTNVQAFYTMSVKDYTNGKTYGYNQVYTVKADATEDKFTTDEAEKDKKVLLSPETVPGWNDKNDKDNKPDRYINCGDLVFDGIGATDIPVGDKATVFNYDPAGETKNALSYTYTLSSYQNGKLFYTRTSTNNDGKYLFSVDDAFGANWNAVEKNANAADRILTDGSNADGYTYLFDENGDLEKALVAESGGGIYVNKADEDGKFQDSESKDTADYYPVVKSGTCTILFVDGDYLYYSVSGGSGYTFNRVDYTGGKGNYGVMPADDEVDDYTPVKILDLDASSSWFAPELVDNQLLFATENDSDYINSNYIMACDLRDGEGKPMDNSAINDMNKKFEGITEVIDEFNDADKYDSETYKNLTAALRYAYITGETADVYLEKLAKACNEKAVKDAEKDVEVEEDSIYSEETLAEYAAFLTPTKGNVWEDYADDYKQVSGEKVYANRRDYYYSYVGKLADEDADEYIDALRAKLEAMPEVKGWWNNQTTAVKVCVTLFPILGGLLLIGGGVVLALWLVKRKKEKLPAYTKKKVKVDTTDDKNINVYEDESSSENEQSEE